MSFSQQEWERRFKTQEATIAQLREQLDEAYINGLAAYAWWKDGTQYVGTCGTTFKQAVARYQAEKNG